MAHYTEDSCPRPHIKRMRCGTELQSSRSSAKSPSSHEPSHPSSILDKTGNLQLSPGSRFANRFEIQHAAGSGGMDTVYCATDRYSGDTVALKLLHAGGRSDEGDRFAREAQLLSELRHPGIVSHIAHGQTPDGQRFPAMDWLEGQDVRRRVRPRPHPRQSLRSAVHGGAYHPG